VSKIDGAAVTPSSRNGNAVENKNLASLRVRSHLLVNQFGGEKQIEAKKQ